MTDALEPLANRSDILVSMWAPEPVDDRSSGDDLIDTWSSSGPFKGEDPLKGVSRESIKMEEVRFMADIRLAFQERGSHLTIFAALARAADERPSMLPAIMKFLDDELFPQCPNLKALFDEVGKSRTRDPLYALYEKLVNCTLERVALVISLNADGSTHYPLSTTLSAIAHWLDAIAAFPSAHLVSHSLTMLGIYADRNSEASAFFGTFTKDIPNYKSLSTREKLALLRGSVCQLGLQGKPPLPQAELPCEIPILDCEEVCRGRQTVDPSGVDTAKLLEKLDSKQRWSAIVHTLITLLLVGQGDEVSKYIDRHHAPEFQQSLSAVLPFEPPTKLDWTVLILMDGANDPLFQRWLIDACVHLAHGKQLEPPKEAKSLQEVKKCVGFYLAFPQELFRFQNCCGKSLPCPVAESSYFKELVRTHLKHMVATIASLPEDLYGPFQRTMSQRHGLQGDLDVLEVSYKTVETVVAAYQDSSPYPLLYFLLHNTEKDLKAGKGTYRGKTVPLVVDDLAKTLGHTIYFSSGDTETAICNAIKAYFDPDAEHKQLLSTPLPTGDPRIIKSLGPLLNKPEHAPLLLQEPVLSLLKKHVATQHEALLSPTDEGKGT